MSQDDPKIEGYWYGNNVYNNMYPMPVHSNAEHPRKQEILEAHDNLVKEANDKYGNSEAYADNGVVIHGYRGFSTCRCCGIHNGSREYEYNGWRWPQGFRHYVETHNVVPSKEFLKEVLGIEL